MKLDPLNSLNCDNLGHDATSTANHIPAWAAKRSHPRRRMSAHTYLLCPDDGADGRRRLIGMTTPRSSPAARSSALPDARHDHRLQFGLALLPQHRPRIGLCAHDGLLGWFIAPAQPLSGGAERRATGVYAAAGTGGVSSSCQIRDGTKRYFTSGNFLFFGMIGLLSGADREISLAIPASR